MKMSFKNVALSFMALSMGLVSCQNDNEIPVVKETETGSLTFKLRTAELMTKALETTASDAEKAVKTVHAFVYKDDGSLEKTATFAGSDFTLNGSTYEPNAEIAVADLSVGGKTVYVGVNMPTTLVNAIVANSATGITSLYSEALANMTSSSSGFTMFCDAGKSVTVEKDIVVSVSGAFSVTRVMAKASVKKKAALSLPLSVAGGQITDITYAVQNNNTQFYLKPAVCNPLGTLVDAIPSSFTQVTNIPSPNDWDATPAYMLENYQDPQVSTLPTYPTYIRVRCAFTPDKFVTGNANNWGESTTPNANGDFWTIATSDGKVAYFLTLAEAQAYKADKGLSTDVKVYSSGKVDYGVFLNTNANKFDVLRNYYYVITITAINGLGEPEDTPQIEPEEKGSIDFTLEVNDWIPMPSEDEQLS